MHMDFAFQFAMAGREAEAGKQYADNWTVFDENVGKERGNITVPGERAELADELDELRGFYQKKGSAFFSDAQPDRAPSDLFRRTTPTGRIGPVGGTGPGGAVPSDRGGGK